MLASATAASACQAEIKAKQGSTYVHTWVTVNVASCTPAAIKASLQTQGYSNVRVVNVSQ
ncbi:MAG: hypothetical protein GY717_12560 [Rhodobacteraceae bacterium]|nr:hypothetical protein [Paracoccaceae bacterium]